MIFDYVLIKSSWIDWRQQLWDFFHHFKVLFDIENMLIDKKTYKTIQIVDLFAKIFISGWGISWPLYKSTKLLLQQITRS